MISNETLEFIKRRRSVRSYKSQQIGDDELKAILEAGQFAPHSGREEAWHFTVVQNRELLDRLNLAAKEAARMHQMEHLKALGCDEGFDCLYGAPTLVIISGSKSSPIPLDADCAAAAENMLIAAESMGVGSCWVYFAIMAFSSPKGEQLRSELKIPEGYKPYFGVLFGHKGEEPVKAPERKPGVVTIIR